MAGNATTHVIEIEKGVGEPTFIPLTLGSELAPISVGRRGMWRIEGARILDVHAFVYFDGKALFLQSADGSQPALAEGQSVSSQWTELRSPCRIDIGSARLHYRSLIEEDDGAATVARAVSTEEREAFAREVAARRNNASATGTPPPPPAPPRNSKKPAPPGNDRPFEPGQFAPKANDSESTRFNPVNASTGPRPAAGMSPGRGQSGAMQSVHAPPPMEAEPLPGDATRVEAGPIRRPGGYPNMGSGSNPGMSPVRPSTGAYPQAAPQQQSAPPPAYSGSMQQAQPPQMMGSGGYPQQGMQQPPMTGSGGYPMSPMSGSYPQPGMPSQGQQMGAMGMGPPVPTGAGPMMMPVNNGVQTVMVAAPPANKVEELIAQFNASSPPRKVALALAPFAIIAAMYVLFSDDDGDDNRTAQATGSSSAVVSGPGPLPTTSNYIIPAPWNPTQPGPGQPGAQPWQPVPGQPGVGQPGQVGQPGMYQPGQPGYPAQPGYPTQPGQQPYPNQPGQVAQPGPYPQPGQPGQYPQPGQVGQPGQYPQPGQVGQPGQPGQPYPGQPGQPQVAQPSYPPQPYPGQPGQPGQPQPGLPAQAGNTPGGQVVAPPGSPAGSASSHTTQGGFVTNERRAVDALASGDAPTALALYSQLMREHPENPVFSDAVRILMARVDAGAPIR